MLDKISDWLDVVGFDEGRVAATLPDLMTIDEVAVFLAVSKATIYGWRKEDKAPPAVKVGKHLRFPKTALLRWTMAIPG